MPTLAQRRTLLTAALGFTGLRWREPVSPAVLALARWMNSWPGLGAVVGACPEAWRANFYDAGTVHSVVLGSAYEPTPWAACRGRRGRR